MNSTHDDGIQKAWGRFLHSPAISYAAPSDMATPATTASASASADTGETSPSSSSKPSHESHPRDYYWHRTLLEQWHAALDDGIAINPSKEDAIIDDVEGGVSNISYGCYILMAAFLAEKLSRLLSLTANTAAPIRDDDDASCHRADEDDHDDDNDDNARRVGIAIPEGPFLPLYILAIHSLNLAVSEDWLLSDNNEQEEGATRETMASSTTATKTTSTEFRGRRCSGVVLIPMETEEAPERLKHILSDASPHVIFVAPGRDWQSVQKAVLQSAFETKTEKINANPTMPDCQLVDYIQFTEEALSSIRAHHNMQQRQQNGSSDNSLVEQLWPPDTRIDSMHSPLRHDARDMPKCFDAARLVAIGCIRLISTLSTVPSSPSASPSASSPDTDNDANNHLTSFPSFSKRSNTISHIVYTSGTTGKPKGCVSSLSSLLHYIRAKNVAHGIGVGNKSSSSSSLSGSRQQTPAGDEESDDGRRPSSSRVLLASAITFDPCFSDILATCSANATLCVAPRERLHGHDDVGDGGRADVNGGENNDESKTRNYTGLTAVLRQLRVTHVLCTPTLWETVEGRPPRNVPSLEVVALGGEAISAKLRGRWARRSVGSGGRARVAGDDDDNGDGDDDDDDDDDDGMVRLFDREYPRLYATYGVTEACVYQTCGEVVISECSCDDDAIREMAVSSSSNGESPSSKRLGQSVGPPMMGTRVRILRTSDDEDDATDDASSSRRTGRNADSTEPAMGEVVLSGAQVDAVSSYRNLPDLTARSFVRRCRDDGGGSSVDADDDDDEGCDSYFYRTGDVGYVDASTGNLHIVGRIEGDGMVKWNGIRLELSEIENATIDDDNASVIIGDEEEEGGLVVDCMAAIVTSYGVDSSADSINDDDDDDDGATVEQHVKEKLVAYCLLSAASRLQLGISSSSSQRVPRRQNGEIPIAATTGVIVPPGPLLSLLRARCDRRVRKGCVPSHFVVIDRLPLSPTGKRDRSALPPLAECSVMGGSSSADDEDGDDGLLRAYGRVGPVVADMVCDVLNLQHCQKQLVTLDASFFALGGDSLGATRLVRGLYASYHGIMDSRNLGGATGSFDGPFAAKHLLQSNTLGDYVKFLESRLDSSSVFETSDNSGTISNGRGNKKGETNAVSHHGEEGEVSDPLYDALIRSITRGHNAVALALLDLGVDPNSQPSGGRMGKVTDRKQQRALFKSNPLHLACSRGNPHLVRKLLSKGCKANVPNASGSFPIHLACSRLDDEVDGGEKEDLNRRDCVNLLLDSGRVPITIKDASKQTILHCAARSGHIELLKNIMDRWKVAAETIGIKFKSHNNVPGRIYDWHDRWFRTPVHWAVLNGRTSALEVLLDGGSSAFPPKPKSGVSKRSTGALIETPLEMCIRLYGDTVGIGKEISLLLRNAHY